MHFLKNLDFNLFPHFQVPNQISTESNLPITKYASPSSMVVVLTKF